MSGTLDIRADVTWMPAGWIFDASLLALSKELAEIAPELTLQLEQAQTETGYGYLDMSKLNNDLFTKVYEVSSQVLSKWIIQAQNSASVSLIFAFSELRALLCTDNRIETNKDNPSIIILDSTKIWTAKKWMFEMVIEHIAGNLSLADKQASLALIQTAPIQQKFDITVLSEHQLQLVHKSLEWMYERYGDGLGRDTYAPSFFSELTPKIAELWQLL